MKSFRDLNRAELYRSAVEDFAVEVGEKDNAEMIRAALEETGVTWADYVAQHPEVVETQEESVANVVTSKDVTEGTTVKVATPKVKVKEPVVNDAESRYLIKMVRDNTLYETRGYKFTQAHPYALVNPEDAQYILEREDGFRQALPSELEEFYS